MDYVRSNQNNKIIKFFKPVKILYKYFDICN